MKRAEIVAQKRHGTGKGAARSTRRRGRIPAVVYGSGLEPLPISVNYLDMQHALHAGGESENILVNLQLEDQDGGILTLVRDTQHDPLTGFLEHLDFLRVSLDRTLTTTVPLHSVGSPKGVREGGVFEAVIRELEIECLPLDIPDYIEIDVSNMELGDTLHVSDIPENPKYKILTSPELTIALITTPRLETAAVSAEEETEAEAAEEETAAAEAEE